MDLTNLRDSLDVSSREKHPAYASAKKSELRLTRDFKAAALQLTTLYRTSLSSAKRSYASGYAQSLQDILDVVLLRLQQSPSSAPGYRSQLQQQHPQQHHNHHTGPESDREELRWLVRYLRARIEAIKAESEDEEEKDSEEEEEEGAQLGGNEQSAGTDKAGLGQSDAASSPVSAAPTAAVTHGLEEGTVQKASERAEGANEHVVPPSSAVFDFAPPTSSCPPAQANRGTPAGLTKRKIKGGASSHATNQVAPVYVPPPPSGSSASSEEDASSNVISQQTPSKRSSVRLGKRSSGRDKQTGALDLFGKSISAKRRRGMGDRKEDDRRDGGLH